MKKLIILSTLLLVSCSTVDTATTNADVKAFEVKAQAIAKSALSDAWTASKALYTVTQNLTPDQLSAYLKAFGVSDSTTTQVSSVYSKVGAGAAAAQAIATVLDTAASNTASK